MQLIISAAEGDAIAATVENTGGVYLVPAFVGLGAPYWDMYSRGMLIGMTRGTGKAHVVRAALEAIAHQSADMMEAMCEDFGYVSTQMQVDGGASVSGFLLQLQSDIMNMPVVRPAVLETTALGAALLAGLAVGIYASPEEATAVWREDLRFMPSMTESDRNQIRHGWKRAVARAGNWIEH